MASGIFTTMNLTSPFDGTGDINEFFERFDTIATAVEWSDEKKASIIPVYLQVEAKLCFNRLSAEDKKKIKEIKAELIKKFGLSESDYYHEFLKAKLNGEKPTSFALKLEDLIGKAFPTLKSEEKHKLLINKFVDELPKELRCSVKLMGEKSWDETIDMVQRALSVKEEVEVNHTHIRNNKDYSNRNSNSNTLNGQYK